MSQENSFDVRTGMGRPFSKAVARDLVPKGREEAEFRIHTGLGALSRQIRELTSLLAAQGMREANQFQV